VLQGHLSLFAGPEPGALFFPGVEGLHFHDLRHTGNAFAAASGARLRTRWCGWARQQAARGGTMAPLACPCQQAHCTLIARTGLGGRADGAADNQRRELRFLRGAGDENRTRTISLGIRQIRPSDRPDLGIRYTANDRDEPCDTWVNGAPMARVLIASVTASAGGLLPPCPLASIRHNRPPTIRRHSLNPRAARST
jgi:hypothetical protein